MGSIEPRAGVSKRGSQGTGKRLWPNNYDSATGRAEVN